MTEPKRVFEAEVVRKDDPTGSQMSEHVEVRRVPGGVFFGRVGADMQGDPVAVGKAIRELKFKLWLWLVGFALISSACFYGAYTTETVIFAAFLLVAGALCAVAVSLIWVFIQVLRRAPLPS